MQIKCFAKSFQSDNDYLLQLFTIMYLHTYIIKITTQNMPYNYDTQSNLIQFVNVLYTCMIDLNQDELTGG